MLHWLQRITAEILLCPIMLYECTDVISFSAGNTVPILYTLHLDKKGYRFTLELFQLKTIENYYFHKINKK